MQLWKLVPAALLTLAATPADAHCGKCGAGDHAAAEPAAASAPTLGKLEQGVRTFEVTVTDDGFTPAEIRAKAGEKVKLVVTRKVERTCVTDIVMKDLGVNEPLPLGKAVVVTVRPQKGDHRFACAHGHVAGNLVVE